MIYKCWGSNSHGQIGDGTKIDRSLPVNVTNIIPIVSGTSTFLAALSRSIHQNVDPTLFSGVSSGDFVRALSLGQRHSCAIMLSGTLQCWGSNSNGQLGTGVHTFAQCLVRTFHVFGTGDTVDKLTATVVKGLASAVVLVACGSRHTCIKLRGSNRLMCFGFNDFGQSSQATSAPSSVPLTELRFIDHPGKDSFSSTVGALFVCISLNCFALLIAWPAPPRLFVLTLSSPSALGEQHSCVHTRQSQEVRSQVYVDHKGMLATSSHKFVFLTECSLLLGF